MSSSPKIMIKSKESKNEQLQQAKSKLEKEAERQRLKEQREKERLERQRVKDEKERERLEKQRVKDEKDREKVEKQRVLDEKKALEQQKADELKAKTEKVQEKFKSFFIKQDKAVETPKPKYEGRFVAFQLKVGMTLAPTVRTQLPSNAEAEFNAAIRSQAVTPDKLYLREIKTKSRQPLKSIGTLASQEEEIQIVDVNEEVVLRRAKLLQFEENYRPAYYGTWQKRSRLVSGRRPFAKDPELLNYEVDSDDEWEEEPADGEECRSDDEEEQGDPEPVIDSDGENMDEDGFFVDHGYLSEGEGVDEDDDEKLDPSVRLERAKLKDKLWRDEKLNKKFKKLVPVVFGLSWTETDPKFNPVLAERLNKFRAIPTVTLPIDTQLSLGQTDDTKTSPKSKTSTPSIKGLFPPEALPDFTRLVNNNRYKKDDMLTEFQQFWLRKSGGDVSTSSNIDIQNCDAPWAGPQLISPPFSSGFKISRKQLDLTLKRVAVRDPKLGRWLVRPEFLSAADGSTSVDSENHWVWITTPSVLDSACRSAKRASVREASYTAAVETPVIVKCQPPSPLSSCLPVPLTKVVESPLTVSRKPARRIQLAEFTMRSEDTSQRDTNGSLVMESPPTKIQKLGSPYTPST